MEKMKELYFTKEETSDLLISVPMDYGNTKMFNITATLDPQ